MVYERSKWGNMNILAICAITLVMTCGVFAEATPSDMNATAAVIAKQAPAEVNIVTKAVVAEANIVPKAVAAADANVTDPNKVQKQAAEVKAADANLAAPKAAEPNSVEGFDGAIQSLTFKRDMSIRDALRFLAAKYHKNIVPSLKVEGPITVTSLYDVTFEEALAAILGKSFKYEEDGSFIKVYSADEYGKIKADTSRMQYKVFTLYYISAAEAAKLLAPVKSEVGLISMTTPAETQISGGTSSDTSGGLGGGSKGGGDSTAIHDTVVMHDFPENIAQAEQVITSVDTRPKQVLIEATIMSATLTDNMELGVDLNFLSGKGFINDVKGATGGTPIETMGFFGTQTGKGLAIGVTAGDLVGLISALESITDTTILANPKILAVNKQEGAMLIGKNLGYRDSTTIGAGGVATQGEVKFLKSGTQLVFRPYIGNDGYIRMEIYPKDSTATLNDQGVPTEITTELKSNIMVKEGETIVIAGLFRDVVESTRNQVPVLGDLPIIGFFFRGTTDRTTRQEVIVLLTPHIIEQAGQTGGDQRMDDANRKIIGAAKEMPWLSRTRIDDALYSRAVCKYGSGDKCGAMADLDWVLYTQPTYLEALRLRERIVRESMPNTSKVIERLMLEKIDKEEAPMWTRR